MAVGLPVPAAADLPMGDVVRHGEVDVTRGTDTLTVFQGSRKAVIDWDGFSIGPGRLAEFFQPGKDSAVLNRVTGHLGSEIHGNLRADGRVILINPNGIVVGPDGRIDTAGFTGSTLEVTDNDFLEGGDLVFAGDSAAAIVNLGRIEALDGDVFLLARDVRNEGELAAPGGTVGLGGGTEVRLFAEGEERLSVRPSVDGGTVDHRGAIDAVTAELHAAGGNAYALAVNSGGIVRASGKEERDGRIFLRGEDGDVRHTGSLEASSENAGAAVTVTGRNIGIVEDASIVAGAGGTGGAVRVVGTGETRFSGTMETGENGFGEISGFGGIHFSGSVLTHGGVLWLDPIDFTIGGEGGDDISGDALSGLLANQNVVIETAGGEGGEGDLFINESVSWDSSYSLGLLAHRHIRANAGVQAGGEGELVLAAGWDGETGFGAASGAGLHQGFVDAGALLADPDSYGHVGGSVFIGDGVQTEGIAVGSRFGGTTVVGHELNLHGGSGGNDRYAQLGFRTPQGSQDFDIDAPITLALSGDLTAQGGPENLRNHVQLGHGGAFEQRDTTGNYRGDITILRAGDIRFLAGATNRSARAHAHLGHGGFRADGNHGGDITILRAGDLIFTGGTHGTTYVHLGHGGFRVRGDFDGDITIGEVNDIVFTSGTRTNTSYAQLGHGGQWGSGDRQ